MEEPDLKALPGYGIRAPSGSLEGYLPQLHSRRHRVLFFLWNTNRSRMRTPGGTQTPSRQVKRLTFLGGKAVSAQSTPSFFCRLEEEVVYWKVRRLSG